MQFKEAFNKAAAICSASEKCAADIRKKLETWEVGENDTLKVIEKLIQEKFIDHYRYCSFYVRDKFRFNKWGKRKLEFELRRKSIESSIIREALNKIQDEDYENCLLEILEQKLKQTKSKNPYDTKAALIRFALSRGFENDVVYSAIEKVLKN